MHHKGKLSLMGWQSFLGHSECDHYDDGDTRWYSAVVSRAWKAMTSGSNPACGLFLYSPQAEIGIYIFKRVVKNKQEEKKQRQ